MTAGDMGELARREACHRVRRVLRVVIIVLGFLPTPMMVWMIDAGITPAKAIASACACYFVIVGLAVLTRAFLHTEGGAANSRT